MSYSEFDVSSWGRKEHFEVLSSVGQCTFSQTVQLDITKLLEHVKSNGYKFYPCIIHVIAKTVNRFAEFKMAMKDGKLIVWDIVHPSYTIFHPETETFSSLWSIYHNNFDQFVSEFEKDRGANLSNYSYFPKGFVENIFYVSANPWTSFTSFDFNFPSINNFFAPMFTIGKYYSEGDKTFVPLAVQVHHAVCDGFHAGRLINELQRACDELVS